MNMNVLLISEKTLKEFNIADNLDATYLTPAIMTSQDIYLTQIIGSKLVDKIKLLVSTGEIVNEENKEYKILLDDYITAYLQYKACAELTLPLAYKERNAGVVQTNNEYVVNTGMKDAKYLESYYNDRADYYGLRMTAYIKANSTYFPEYNCSGCDGSVSPSNSTDCQIYLD